VPEKQIYQALSCDLGCELVSVYSQEVPDVVGDIGFGTQ
jgi:hypothetical protein